MTFEPHGVSPAIVTPFTKDGAKVDEAAYRQLIRFCIDDLGVDGLLAAGTTGEFTSLSIDEHKRVLEIAVEEAAGKAFVFAGAGTSSTKTTLELVKYSEKIGADSALVVAPYYLRPSSRGLYEHYRLVSEVGLPIMLYNIPQTTGLNIPWQIIEDLAQLDNIVGIKDSGGELKQILAILEKVGSKIKVLVGHDEVVFPALASGCAGCILASAQLIGDIWKDNPGNELVHLRSLKWRDLSECRDCTLSKYCKKCIGLAFSETGSLTRPAPSACRDATLKSEYFGERGC